MDSIGIIFIIITAIFLIIVITIAIKMSKEKISGDDRIRMDDHNNSDSEGISSLFKNLNKDSKNIDVDEDDVDEDEQFNSCF